MGVTLLVKVRFIYLFFKIILLNKNSKTMPDFWKSMFSKLFNYFSQFQVILEAFVGLLFTKRVQTFVYNAGYQKYKTYCTHCSYHVSSSTKYLGMVSTQSTHALLDYIPHFDQLWENTFHVVLKFKDIMIRHTQNGRETTLSNIVWMTLSWFNL